jgi:hypothetical protein
LLDKRLKVNPWLHRLQCGAMVVALNGVSAGLDSFCFKFGVFLYLLLELALVVCWSVFSFFCFPKRFSYGVCL